LSKSYRLSYPSAAPDQIRFLTHCVCCGSPAQASSNLVVTRQVQRKRKQETEILHYPVPHCDRCHRGTKAVFMVGMIPFLAGFIVLGGGAFLWLMVYASNQGIDQNIVPGSMNSITVGAAAGLVVGLVAGFLFELLARLLLLPLFGQALWQAPLLIAQFIRDSDYVAGLHGRLHRPTGDLLLRFQRDDLADLFAAENRDARPVKW
jgi:hypothetical protein